MNYEAAFQAKNDREASLETIEKCKIEIRGLRERISILEMREGAAEKAVLLADKEIDRLIFEGTNPHYAGK